MTGDRDRLGVAVIGFGWMGEAHTRAYARVRHHFADLTLEPDLVLVTDEVQERAEAAAARYGFEAWSTRWQDVITDDRVDAVSVTAPNFLHREIGVAVATAGKHLWIEKPVGLSATDAESVSEAARKAGVASTVGFNYRHAPAVQRAREMIMAGEIGTVTHASFRFLSDYAAHPDGALTWRYDRERGGSGVLGDLASHAADLAWFLLGPIESVVADTATFIAERPIPTGPTSAHVRSSGTARGPVHNEDYVSALVRFVSGARATLEVSRIAVGDQNAYGFTIHGTRGAVSWDFRRMGELQVSAGGDIQDQPTATLQVRPGDGAYGAFQPGAAVGLGFDDLKVIEAAGFVQSVATGLTVGPALEDAVRSAKVIAALEESARNPQWIQPET